MRCWSSQPYCDAVSSARLNSTPDEPRAMSLSSQPRSGRPARVRVSPAETTTSRPASCAAASTPCSTAPDQELSSECTTRSTSPDAFAASNRGLRT